MNDRARTRPPVIDRMLGLWNGGDVDAIDEIYAPDCVDEVGRELAPGEIHEEILKLRAAFPDQQFEVERELISEDQVVLCLRWHGTHHGSFTSPFGVLEPSGRRFSVHGIEIFDVREDRVVRAWMAWDLTSLVLQLGGRLNV